MAWHAVVLSRASTITALVLAGLAQAPTAIAEPKAAPSASVSPSGREAFGYTKIRTESPLSPRQSPVAPLDPFRLASAPALSAVLPALPKDYAAVIESNDPGVKLKTRAMQIGVSRPFEQPLTVNATHAGREQWTTLTNGWRIFSAYVSSPNALGMRLHFQDLLLPAGARIVIYDPVNTATPAVTIDTSNATAEVWAPTIFSDTAVAECQLPPGADPETVSFTISGLSHIYNKAAFESISLKEGACEVDVSCYSGYASQAAGVALISYVSGGNTYTCSGCLLASSQQTAAEYFLTAKHCIGNQTLASSIEFYWFFQTSSCNGTPPAISSVPTTKGADLLASSTANDFSFLRLRQAAPDGVSFLGWSVNQPATGQAVACIHHPDGAYKRIAIGKFYGFDSDFWAAQWSKGVTENGSSGSPLLNANHQVIGQLNGGFTGPGSSCANPSDPDQYGRFDLTYPAIAKWIDPGSGGGGGGGGDTTSTVPGTYYGLFQSGTPDPQTSGAFTLTTTAKGRFTGRIRMGVVSWPFSGALDVNGAASVAARRGNLNPLQIQLTVSPDSENLSGSLGDGTWSATMTGYRAVFVGTTTASDQTGRYTMVVPAPASTGLGGSGYGVINVARNGRLTFSGALPDGAHFAQSTFVSRNGQWPLYIPMYAGKGYLFSWVNFTSSSSSDLSGQLYWNNPSDNGFSTVASVSGSYFTPALQGNNLLNFSDGLVALNGGDLGSALQGEIWLYPNGRVVNKSDLHLNLAFSPGNGVFNGTVIDPDTKRPMPVHGVALQKSNVASGYFIGGGQSGQVVVEP